jgi:hypothetical protein
MARSTGFHSLVPFRAFPLFRLPSINIDDTARSIEIAFLGVRVMEVLRYIVSAEFAAAEADSMPSVCACMYVALVHVS